jgi:type I restriction enzyme, S subunit
MSEKDKLPKGWELKKLGDIGQIISGGTPSTKNPEYWEGDISWISPADLSNYDDKYITKGRKSITDLGLKYSSARLMPKGSVLFSSRAPIGYVVIAATEMATNQGFKSIIPNNNISSEYLYHYLKSAKNLAEKYSSGTTFKEISLKSFSILPIPLPPLPEQEKIVAKIEELFSELDKGKEQLLTALQQLKVYRQGVLKYAFEGKLTNKKFKDGELPKGWKWVKFNDVCTKIGDIDHKMPKQVEKSDYPYLSTKDFTDELKISFDKAKYISKEDYLNLSRKIKPEKGDIIFPRYGTIGKNILIDFDKIFLVSYSCAIVKPNHSLIDSKYIYFLSLSPLIHEEIRKYVVETTQANIGIASIKEFIFPLPKNIEEQQQIVAEIERRLSVCDKIEETINQALSQTETLRQSILKKAFEGKLV